MRLTPKAMLLVAGALLFSQVLVFASASALILLDHRQQEEDAARRDVQLIGDTVRLDVAKMGALAQQLTSLTVALTGASALDGNTTQALARDIFVANDIDRIVMEFPDENGTLSSFAFFLDNGTLGWALDPPLPSQFHALSSSQAGIAWVDGAPQMMAGEPVPLQGGLGSIIVARDLDQHYMDGLTARTGLDAVLLHPDAAGTFRIDRVDAERLQAFAPLAIGDAPALAVRVDLDRDIYQEAWTNVYAFGVGSLAAALIVLAVTGWLLRAWVTAPIGRLRAKVLEKDPDAEGLSARDEIDALDRAYEHLIAQVAEEQRRIQDSNRDLSSFASVVSHDLKSPLSTLRLTLGSLRRHPELQDARSQEQLQRMDRTIDGMRARIDGILAYSRASEADAEMQHVSLDRIMARVQDDLRAATDEAGVRLDVRRLPNVIADPEPLAQLLQNLVGNAIKYRREDVPGQVRVWATRDGEHAVLHVRDNGRGFNEEEARHMMDAFVRLASAEGTEGHGIGLATCRRIAERHGSELNAIGRPGSGAEFTFRLPLAPRREARPARPSRQADAVPHGTPRPRASPSGVQSSKSH